MPKAKSKQEAKRRTARILVNIRNSIYMLARLYEQFNPHHHNEAELLATIGQLLIAVEEELVKFWERCWGELPENIDSWT